MSAGRGVYEMSPVILHPSASPAALAQTGGWLYASVLGRVQIDQLGPTPDQLVQADALGHAADNSAGHAAANALEAGQGEGEQPAENGNPHSTEPADVTASHSSLSATRVPSQTAAASAAGESSDSLEWMLMQAIATKDAHEKEGEGTCAGQRGAPTSATPAKKTAFPVWRVSVHCAGQQTDDEMPRERSIVLASV